MRGILFIVAAVLAVSAVAACPTVSSTNTKDLLNEIPNINQQMQTCPINLGPLSWVLKHPTQVDILMSDGTTESLTVSIVNKQATSVSRGSTQCVKRVVTNERDVDAALASSNRGGALLYLFKTKGFTIQGCTIWTRFTSGFVNPLGRFFAGRAAPATMPSPAPAGPSGKPEYCDDTWLPGHQGYVENKALWDSYSAATDAVCQSQYGRGTPSPCIHTVQLSVQGNPYYLCWYNK